MCGIIDWVSDIAGDIGDFFSDDVGDFFSDFGDGIESFFNDLGDIFDPDLPEIPEFEQDFVEPVPGAERGALGVRRRAALDPRVTEVNPFGLDDLLTTSSDTDINLPG